ncbi:thiolase family protein [Geochorda subterranea]|uniref:Acetoacetyl-CoA thiolase n=1 Tax=Geochorda subterranea TaxID=3109564 RepID=A0ABZ1BN28_9FIRM|nr:acetyl-CoA C-acyltransferase [Limnochorda sp. LNt]WRP14192.1 acetyl-CoA C-acyltransferase [Limnochorda sp. LNt]
MREAVIVGAARTPIGAFLGVLSALSAPQLGASAIRGAVERSGVRPEDVDEVIMGNVLGAGLGQAPARQAALLAGLPRGVPCLTINKMCGSGLKAVMLAAQAIASGDADVVVAGGMESMSNAPYVVQGARAGLRMGHGRLVDTMIHDGLWDVYNDCHMGSCAELLAERRGFSRQEQDDYALESYRRARAAMTEGALAREIVPVQWEDGRGERHEVHEDEEPGRLVESRFRQLKPAFKAEGTVTPGNASSISDGAAAVVVVAEPVASRMGLRPMARIVAQAQAATDPEWFTVAPIAAIRRVLGKAGLDASAIDLYEINEAFAVVPMVAIRELGLDPGRVNVRGGAIALGHPIGASGARVLVTLLFAMEQRGARRGLATLCIGGGEAVALVVERVP